VADHTEAAVETEALAPFMVKGKAEPVEAFVVRGLAAAVGRPRTGDALPLRGRAEELARLGQEATAVGAGAGRIVDVIGEPGMGKSRLVTEAAAAWPLPTLWLNCEGYRRSTPYLPFRWLLRALLEQDESASAEAVANRLRSVVAEKVPELAPWLPLLAEVVGVTAPATAEVEALERQFLRRRLEDSVLTFLSALLQQPTAIVFEDAHQMDAASRDLLGRLARQLDSPWLLVLARRPDGAGAPVPADLPGLVTLELAPLGPDDALAVFRAAAPDVALAGRDRAEVIGRAAGNPLFLRELATAAHGADSVAEIPVALEQLLASQLDRLLPADLRILRAAAVLGVRFAPGQLDDLLDERLDQARGTGASAWDRLATYLEPAGDGHLRFANAMVRDAAYEGLSFKRRASLHGRAMDSLERGAAVPDDHAELLSLHALHAGRLAAVWRYAGVAGDRAAALYANADAAVFYRRALTAAHRMRGDGRPDTAPVAEALGDVAEQAGEFASAADAYELARRRRTAPADRARLLRKTGVVHERFGRYREALRCYTRGRSLLGASSGRPETAAATAEAAELAIAYAGVRYRQGRYRDCVRWASTATLEAETVGHRPGLAHALYLQDMALFDLALPSGDAGRRALAIYEEVGDLVGQGNVLNNMGIDAYYQGRWDEALSFYERSRAVRARAGDVIGMATQENNIGEILSDQGHYQEAARLFAAARDEWRAADYRVGVALATSNLGRLAVRHGDLAAGTAHLEDARARFETIGATVYVAETEAREIEALVVTARTAEAEQALTALENRIATLDGAELLVSATLRLRAVAVAVARTTATGTLETEATSMVPTFDTALALLDDSVERARAVGGTFELAQSLAARAVVGTWAATLDDVAADARRVPDPAEDARAAMAQMADLGVIDVPITSITDRWPAAGVALATAAVKVSPS
jgi:tetratricopeptide (TPR) repeat protein